MYKLVLFLIHLQLEVQLVWAEDQSLRLTFNGRTV